MPDRQTTRRGGRSVSADLGGAAAHADPAAGAHLDPCAGAAVQAVNVVERMDRDDSARHRELADDEHLGQIDLGDRAADPPVPPGAVGRFAGRQLADRERGSGAVNGRLVGSGEPSRHRWRHGPLAGLSERILGVAGTGGIFSCCRDEGRVAAHGAPPWADAYLAVSLSCVSIICCTALR